MALPGQYRPLEVEYPFPYPVKACLVYIISRYRREYLAFKRGVTYVVFGAPEKRMGNR